MRAAVRGNSPFTQPTIWEPKMTLGNDPEVFINAFECAAMAAGWPENQCLPSWFHALLHQDSRPWIPCQLGTSLIIKKCELRYYKPSVGTQKPTPTTSVRSNSDPRTTPASPGKKSGQVACACVQNSPANYREPKSRQSECIIIWTFFCCFTSNSSEKIPHRIPVISPFPTSGRFFFPCCCLAT